MHGGRRRHGFERLGTGGARELVLPPARARELVLADAWRRAAGTALAARARALRVDRGVLEIEVPERRWADALKGQLRELASLVAALAPDLHVRKLRVRLPDGSEAIPAAPLTEEPSTAREAGGVARKGRAGDGQPRPTREAVTPEALERLRDRYLATSDRNRRTRR